MNVPPTTPATANSIVAQFRARPANGFRGAKYPEHYTIPPMSMVFATGDSSDMVSDVSATTNCFPGKDSIELRRIFKGVSGGLWGLGLEISQQRTSLSSRGGSHYLVPYRTWNEFSSAAGSKSKRRCP